MASTQPVRLASCLLTLEEAADSLLFSRSMAERVVGLVVGIRLVVGTGLVEL